LLAESLTAGRFEPYHTGGQQNQHPHLQTA
jgi:hypothetical protein